MSSVKQVVHHISAGNVIFAYADYAFSVLIRLEIERSVGRRNGDGYIRRVKLILYFLYNVGGGRECFHVLFIVEQVYAERRLDLLFKLIVADIVLKFQIEPVVSVADNGNAVYIDLTVDLSLVFLSVECLHIS